MNKHKLGQILFGVGTVTMGALLIVTGRYAIGGIGGAIAFVGLILMMTSSDGKGK